MSEGLRAEDVKEARAAIDWWENAVYTELTEVEEDHVRSLVVVAKAHLVSQEQTPDLPRPGALTSPTVERIAQVIYGSDLPTTSHDRRGRMTPWERLPGAHRRPFRKAAKSVLAALVGFHPQSTESPEVLT